jgi:hypothetical protein
MSSLAKRLIEEHDDLKGKIDRLAMFLRSGGPADKGLGCNDVMLLKKQLEAMENYLLFLSLRIDRLPL